ncbi:MAG: YdcH family protein [Myxococcales bacterium]|nr:YdcH family protein [Myxococcales bacterium]
MSEGHHDLVHEFPEHRDAIHTLKMNDGHFARLASDYHDLAKELHRIEVGAETPDDMYVEELKKKRLFLLDEIHGILHKANEG